MSPERIVADVDGRHLSLSNLGKVLYPASGFTKGAVLDYYSRVAAMMLPHVQDRPVTFRRFPDGVSGKSFVEKHVPSHAPDWVRTVKVPSSGAAAGDEKHRPPAMSSTRSSTTGHPSSGRRTWPPSSSTCRSGTQDAAACCLAGPITWSSTSTRAGNLDRGVLPRRTVDLGTAGRPRPSAVAKTSGSKGLQVYVRLPARSDGTPPGNARCGSPSRSEKDHPGLVVTNMKKELRRRRVLIDWSQNHPAKTTVAAYSLRGGASPSVSAPVTWDEVRDCERSGDPDRLRFDAGDVLDRIERHGDLFAALA